jgi:GxxExxY protein
MHDDEAFADEEMEPDPDLNRITNAVIGCAIAVHRELGPGQLESCYEKALAIEFAFRGIPFERQAPVLLMYRGQVVGEGRMDFLVERRVVVDLKAVETIAPVHRVQMLAYLKMTKHKLGIIINFNVPVLIHGIRRIAN